MTISGGQGGVSREEQTARGAAGMPAEHPEMVMRRPGRAKRKEQTL